MSVKGVIVRKKIPPSGVRTTADGISGLVAHAVAVPSTFVLGTTYKLFSLRDAESLGITEAYDNTNNLLLWYHIKEYYEETSLDAGTPLYIMGVAQSITFVAMVEDTAVIYGKKIMLDAKGEIKQLAYAYNPTVYTPTLLNGVDTDLITAVGKAQLLHDYSVDNAMPLVVILEGKNGFLTPAAMQDFRAIAGVKAPNVAVCFGQDFDKADAKPIWNKHAAIGTLLGSVAARRVNESCAWVEVGNIQDVPRNRWVKPAFSNHILIDFNKADWQLLENKSVIFPITYAGLDGVFWNSDYTCDNPISDTEGYLNEWNLTYGRTLNKAIRSVYAALLPSVKSPQPVNPNTGKLDIGVIALFKAKALARIDSDMANEISGRDVFIDKDSDLINSPRELKAGVVVVPFGSTDSIRVDVALKKSI
jgi:hypothetical protein